MFGWISWINHDAGIGQSNGFAQGYKHRAVRATKTIGAAGGTQQEYRKDETLPGTTLPGTDGDVTAAILTREH